MTVHVADGSASGRWLREGGANPVAVLPPLQDIKFNVHAHPTVSEVIEILVHQCHVEGPAAAAASKPAAKQTVAA